VFSTEFLSSLQNKVFEAVVKFGAPEYFSIDLAMRYPVEEIEAFPF
jgi:hypothetical protein